MSDDSVAKWNCTSGRVASGIARAKMPPWLMPTAIGPRAPDDVVEPHPQLAAPRAQRVVRRDRLRAAEDDARLQMVLQVLADALERVHDRNAVLLQQRGRPDAGQLQQLRRLQRAGGEDHFAPRDGRERRRRPADTRRRVARGAVEQHARRVRIRSRRAGSARLRAGFRYATAVEQRRPRRVVSW